MRKIRRLSGGDKVSKLKQYLPALTSRKEPATRNKASLKAVLDVGALRA